MGDSEESGEAAGEFLGFDPVFPASFVVVILSPLRGSSVSRLPYPRLAPWAAFFRRFAAEC